MNEIDLSCIFFLSLKQSNSSNIGEQLLSLRRQGDTSKRYALNKTTPDWVWKWIMIVLFSLPLSEFTDKTQVIHYPKQILHTRLTQFRGFGCGTFFGRLVGKKIIEKYRI
jgi:hypothetical protein